MSYDRYKRLRGNGRVAIMPTIVLTKKSTDYFETYHKGVTRLDVLSYDYYGDANYDWLIMMANPEYGDLEFKIPDGVELRIPYPLSLTIEDYEAQIDKYNTLYGIKY